MIARVAGERLAKVCLELGGKNPLVVCDDADLDKAADAAALSAFSNAGQRCAAGSRLIVFDAVYDRFRELLLDRARAQKVGPGDEHDFGPVINERQLERCSPRSSGRGRPARPCSPAASGSPMPGFFIAPTIVEGARARRGDLAHRAVRSDHDAPPRRGVRRGGRAREREPVRADGGDLDATASTAPTSSSAGSSAGGVQVNGPTYGFEPHVPFGGLKRLRHRLAGARHRGAGRLLRLEDGLRDARPRGRLVPTAVALVPARAGSQRVPGKNVLLARRVTR